MVKSTIVAMYRVLHILHTHLDKCTSKINHDDVLASFELVLDGNSMCNVLIVSSKREQLLGRPDFIDRE